jgi:hypothetical protein
VRLARIALPVAAALGLLLVLVIRSADDGARPSAAVPSSLTASTIAPPPPPSVHPPAPAAGVTAFVGSLAAEGGAPVGGVEIKIVTALGLGFGPMVDQTLCDAESVPEPCVEPGVRRTRDDGTFEILMPSPLPSTAGVDWTVQAFGTEQVALLDHVEISESPAVLPPLVLWDAAVMVDERFGDDVTMTWRPAPGATSETIYELSMGAGPPVAAAPSGITVARRDVRTSAHVKACTPRRELGPYAVQCSTSAPIDLPG